MPPADVFAHLGLFVAKGFLDAQECAHITNEMSRTSAEAAPIVKDQVERVTGGERFTVVTWFH